MLDPVTADATPSGPEPESTARLSYRSASLAVDGEGPGRIAAGVASFLTEPLGGRAPAPPQPGRSAAEPVLSR